MSNISKIIKKVLMGQSFFEDGYEYQFIKVGLDEEGIEIDITVNVILPKKGQSYATAVFSNGIHRILDNIWGYIGSSFSYSEHILVDGKEPVKGGVYISREKQNKILTNLRNQVTSAEIKLKNNYLSFNVSWNPQSEQSYTLEDVYIDFYYYIGLSNFKIEDKEVIPNLEYADKIAGTIRDSLLDDDNFRNKVDDIIYTTMRDEVDLTKIDEVYFNGIWRIIKIDGWEVSSESASNVSGWSKFGYNIDDNLFT
jgi:hypothetical protein